MTGKPSSVVDDHLSRPGVAAQAPAIAGNTAGNRIIPIASCTRWGLHHGRVARPWVSSYLAFPPLLILADGRYISVALSLESPPPAVSWHPALWCSDFPHTFRHAIVWSPRTFPIIPFHTPKVKWAVPTPGSRLGCAPSVRVRARGASLRLARRHGSRRASRACGGHASQRARRDAKSGVAGRFALRPTGGQCPHPARDWVAHLRSEYARVGPACGLRGGTARGGRAVLAGVTPRKGRGATRNMEMRGGSPRAPLAGSAGCGCAGHQACRMTSA